MAPELGAFLVCDGMGGAAAGEVASRLAANNFLRSLQGTQPRAGEDVAPQARLHHAALAANSAIHRYAHGRPALEGMGTTLVSLLFHPAPPHDRRAQPRASRIATPPDLFLLNVGDSRCYRRRAGTTLQLTTDHTFVEEQVRAGQITPAQAASSPMRNYITRAVGPSPTVEPEIDVHRSEPGDLYLLCSDGLTRELDVDSLGAVLGDALPEGPPTAPELEHAAHALVAAANDRGGHDNITVLLVSCPE